LLTDFEFTEKSQVDDIYPMGYHGADKQGRSIYIERIGMLELEKLWEVTNEDRMM